MKHIMAIAAKELRGYFNSAVALLFLATFLVAVMLFFFFVERFFARNIADVRPFFDWLPLLLIFLVSALTMRLWSEEQKTGTLELLLTLPVPIHRLVVGKFLASLALVALALLLTMGLPITVSQLGELDWGPVIGGYLAALLLASAYLSVGLCVSAATENQIVALIATAVICFLLYLPGMPAVTSLVSIETGEFLRQLGTGSRFESIARGVLDIRDLAYYASLVFVFLTLNTMLLHAKGWGTGEQSRPARSNARLAVLLVALNALALNIWLRPIQSTRIDITAHGLYSLSPQTLNVLDSMEEPLTIRGYFTSTIHPDIDPLVPQIQDLLREYQIAGKGNVRLEFVDPSGDETLEKEANEEYDIQSVSIMSKDRHGSTIVNAYFHVMVSYGSQYEILTFEHLVRVEMDGTNKPLFFLDNIEYEVTRSIRKVMQGFQSVDSLYDEVEGDIIIEALVSRDILPPDTKAVAEKMDSVIKEFMVQSDEKVKYQSFSEPEQLRQMGQQIGMKPYPMPNQDGTFSQLYFHWYVRIGDQRQRIEVIADEDKSTAGVLRQNITNAMRRTVPGFIRVVGLVTPVKKEIQPDLHSPAMEAPAPQNFTLLEKEIGDLYRVTRVDLRAGPISDDIDVLIIATAEKLRPVEVLHVDQFLMRGGGVIAMISGYRPRPAFGSSQAVEIIKSNMVPLLEQYGVKIDGESMVMDPKSERTVMRLGRRMDDVKYPLFVSLDRTQLRDGGVITNGVRKATVHFASPLQRVAVEGAPEVEARILMSSSKDSWLHKSRNVRPDYTANPGLGFARPAVMAEGDTGPHVLAVALKGTFISPFSKDGEESPQVASGQQSLDTVLDRSPSDARLVVIGSSSFASDEMLSQSAQFGGMDTAEANIQFVHNLVDWALEDTELLSIRAIRTTGSLDVTSDSSKNWEYLNYSLALVALLFVVLISRVLPKPTIDRSHVALAHQFDDDSLDDDSLDDDSLDDDSLDDDSLDGEDDDRAKPAAKAAHALDESVSKTSPDSADKAEADADADKADADADKADADKADADADADKADTDDTNEKGDDA